MALRNAMRFEAELRELPWTGRSASRPLRTRAGPSRVETLRHVRVKALVSTSARGCGGSGGATSSFVLALRARARADAEVILRQEVEEPLVLASHAEELRTASSLRTGSRRPAPVLTVSANPSSRPACAAPRFHRRRALKAPARSRVWNPKPPSGVVFHGRALGQRPRPCPPRRPHAHP